MLERAAGCLETSGRHLLRASRKSVKSRRMLHSTFWSHGAVDLHLPPWWTTILQGALDGLGFESRGGLMDRNVYSSPFGDLALDFLYPAKTLEFIQKCSAYGSERWQCHRIRQLSKHGTRSYTTDTSAVGDSVDHQKEDAVDSAPLTENLTESTVRQNVAISEHGISSAVLLNRFETASGHHYDEIWQLYRQAEVMSTNHSLTSSLLAYFSKSSRMVDASRSAQLFESIPLLNRTARVYRNGIVCLLKLNDLQKANEVHKEALPRVMSEGLFGSSRLLARVIQAEDWMTAYEIWKGYIEHKPEDVQEKHLWDATADLPEIKPKLLSLLTYATEKRHQKDEPHQFTDGFVVQFSNRVMSFREKEPVIWPIRRIFDQLEILNIPLAEIYEKAIISLLSLRNGHYHRIAHRLYGRFRESQHFKLTTALLRTLLNKICNAHEVTDVTGIKTVIDDWFRFHYSPDVGSYRIFMRACAVRGNAVAVEALSKQYSMRFPRDFYYIPQLLYVYARRGQIDEAVAKFNEIESLTEEKPTLLCWNILLYAYQRANDVEGLLRCLDNMLNQQVKPDGYTFGTVMALCGNRGNVDAVEDLLGVSDSYGIKRTSAMVDSIVLAHVRNDSLKSAEKIVESASSMDLKGSRTRMWNFLLHAYAMQRDVENARRIHQRMLQVGVQPDGMTYAALMQLLAMLGQTQAAYRLLRLTLQNDRHMITPFHFAIVIGGCFASGQMKFALKIYEHMSREGFRPSATLKEWKLKAFAALSDRYAGSSDTDKVRLELAEEFLDKLLLNVDSMDNTSREPTKGLTIETVDSSYPAMYFEYIVYVYGQRKAFDRVRQLYDKFVEAASRSRPGRPVEPPVKLLTALMVSHLHERKFDDVEKCWDLAREQALRLAKPWESIEASKANRVLYPYRFMLSEPLHWYLKSLDEQGNFSRMKSTIESLQEDGFQLDNKNWNVYIRMLSRGFHYMEAFELCERYLMPGWPGWPKEGGRVVWKKELRHILKPDQYHPGRLFPLYQTIVYLAGSLMDIRALGLSDSVKGLHAQIQNEAPRTLDAVRSLPRVNDEVQHKILRVDE